MPFSFNPSKDIPDLSGKSIFITGGTTGLGAQTALALAAHNPACIYISGRNAKRAEDVIQQAKAVSTTTHVQFVQLDQNDLANVAAAATSFVASVSRLDVLVANAGIMATPAALSANGYESQFAINHLGHAMLIKKLLPLMQSTAEASPDRDVRIIILTSLGFQFARKGVEYETIRTKQEAAALGSWIRYGQSKLANIWYAQELAKRYPAITTVSVHPGTVKTDLVGSLSMAKRMFVYLTNIGSMLQPHEGALNTLWAVSVDKSKLKSGAMYEPVGAETKRIEPNKVWNDPAAAAKLYDWTEQELNQIAP